MRRWVWPPSSPSASRPSWSTSKTTPRASRSRTTAGAASTSVRTPVLRQRPPAPPPPCCGGGRGRGGSCRRRGGRGSRRVRAPPPARPGPRSWRSRSAGGGRRGRRGRRARPPAARSRGRRRRRRRRRRRTQPLALLMVLSPLGLSSQQVELLLQPLGCALARPRQLVGDPLLDDRGAALRRFDALLGRLDLRFDLAQPLLGGGKRLLLLAALALEVGFQRLDLFFGAAL